MSYIMQITVFTEDQMIGLEAKAFQVNKTESGLKILAKTHPIPFGLECFKKMPLPVATQQTIRICCSV